MTKTPKNIRERREQSKARKEEVTRTWDRKYWLALIVSALGLLTLPILEQPTITVEPPLDPKNLMSTHFIVHNDSWCDYSDLKVAAMGNNVTTTAMSGDVRSGWDTLPIPPDLPAGEKMTIAYPFRAVGFGGDMLSGDFGLIMSYRLKYFPFWERRRGFLFTVAVQANGNPRFEQQPGEKIEREYREYEKQQALRPFFPPH